MTFSVSNESFIMDDRKVFLISGEIHYFRIKRDLWDKHLEAAKEAGLTTISTYIPWGWHESREGVFDFEGRSCPERDLKGWLQRCSSHGLHCIVKPGPFILAEYRGAGLPDWFLDRYRDEVKMRTSKGGIVPGDGISLFNKRFLEKAALWYDRIMPFIKEQEASAGGPVIMMQICNEIGVFSWLAHQADYGNDVKERFIAYLEQKFRTISEVNSLWGTDYRDFSDAELPPDGNIPYTSGGDRARDHEWHSFWRKNYGDYLRLFSGMARERGITVPLFHNLPGWIYGNGYEFPVNITMYEDLYRGKSELFFGVDHIPEFVSYRNMHDDRVINDITRAMQGRGPLFAAEFQCGSREYHVVTNPRETELFYKASISNGLTGWNYYMFSQGQNPPCKGHSGEMFYWFNPLTADGERASAFPLVKRMNSIIKTSEKVIVEAKRKAGICVLFYPPYYATEMERPEEGASDLLFIPSRIRRPAYFDGLLKILQVLNVDFDMIDLTNSSVEELREYAQVWAFCTDEMNEKDQQLIVDYARDGGCCVIYPCLPDRELSQKPCNVIRDALGIQSSGKEIIDSPLISIYDFRDIKCMNPQVTFSEGSLSGAEIIARTLKGSACGFTKPLGNGSVIHLGTWLGFDTEGHKPVYETILRKSGARLGHASSDSPYISVRERFTDDGAALLFIGNYYNEEHSGRVAYTHPGTGEQITLPYLHDQMTWPGLYAVLTPVCLEIEEGLKILHSTSDILGIETINGKHEITLHGDRDLPGEIVFEGVNIDRIRTAMIAGQDIMINFTGNRVVLNYDHFHRKEMIMSFPVQ